MAISRRIEFNRPLRREQILHIAHITSKAITNAGRLGVNALAYCEPQPLLADEPFAVQPTLPELGREMPIREQIGWRGHREIGLKLYDGDGTPPRHCLLRGPYGPAVGAYGGFSGKKRATYERVALFQPDLLTGRHEPGVTLRELAIIKLWLEIALAAYQQDPKRTHQRSSKAAKGNRQLTLEEATAVVREQP